MKEAFDVENKIRLPEMEPEIFQEVISFMYTDEANLDNENVLEVMIAADMYALEDLKSKCSAFIAENMDSSCVCSLWDGSKRLTVKMDKI